MRRHVQPLSGVERHVPDDAIIVSKTDLHGKIEYASEAFVAISGYEEEELLGAPHSIMRHPHMPRCVFRLLWKTIESGQDLFAYVINRMLALTDAFMREATGSLDYVSRGVFFRSQGAPQACPAMSTGSPIPWGAENEAVLSAET